MLAMTKISGEGKKSKSQINPGGNSNVKMKANTASKKASAEKASAQPDKFSNAGMTGFTKFVR